MTAEVPIKPLKGAHLILDDEVLYWLRTRLTILEDAYAAACTYPSDDAERAVVNPKKLLNLLAAQGWAREKDKFGNKAWLAMPHLAGRGHHGELRITAALKDDGLHLDIRLWGEY